MVTNSQTGEKNVGGKEVVASVNSEAAMDEYLQKLNLYRKPVAKDGSCLFRAVSEHVFNTQEKHIDVRKACISFMQKNSEQFEAFVPGSFEHHLFGLQNPKEWAGQVEIAALSKLYLLDFEIYQEVNMPPSCVTGNGFNDQILLCFSNGNHYDCVYKKKYEADAALMQSVLYEFLYATVLPECKERDTIREIAHENSDLATDNGSWIEVKPTNSSKDKNTDETVQSGEMISIALWELNRSLDPVVYRNIALEVWEQSKQEQAKIDKAIARNLQFKTGDSCLALLKETSKGGYTTVRIDDIVDEKYFVYEPELNEHYYVFLEALKPLLSVPQKCDQISYTGLPGYYKKTDDPQKDFQYQKKKQKTVGNRGSREEDSRQKKADGRNEQKNDRGGGQNENRSEAVAGAPHQKRDKRDRKGGPVGDKARYEKGEKRENDRRVRSNEKNGKKQDAEHVVSPSGDAKQPEIKDVVVNDTTKNDKTIDDISAAQQGLAQLEISSENETDKESTAKQAESPAAFWGRMRKDKIVPDITVPVETSNSKPNSPTDSKASYNMRSDERSNAKESKKDSAVVNKKTVENEHSVKDTRQERKSAKTVEPQSEKSSATRSNNSGKGYQNKQSKQSARSRAAKDAAAAADSQSKKVFSEPKDNADSVTAERTLSDPGSGLQFMADSVAEKENECFKDHTTHVKTEDYQQPSTDPNHETNKEELNAVPIQMNVDQDRSNMDPYASNRMTDISDVHTFVTNANSQAKDEIVGVVSPVLVNSTPYPRNEALSDNNQNLNSQPAMFNVVSDVDQNYNAEVQHDDDYLSLPADSFDNVTQTNQEGDSSTSFDSQNEPLTAKSEPKIEQRIRILTKNNKDQFHDFHPANISDHTESATRPITREKSPDPEFKKAMSKKVSFGEVVEFSETANQESAPGYEAMPGDTDMMQHPYTEANGMSDMYSNHNYSQPMPVSMMIPMVHGGGQFQIPCQMSIDPEARDLPEDLLTVQYFFNMGLQFYMMQHHGPPMMNMHIPQMSASASHLHHQPMSVQSSSHIQMSRYVQPTDVITQINDQQEDHIPVSADTIMHYDVPGGQQQQLSHSQQRHYHAQNQSNANQYEPPPRMRRRGRGATYGPQSPTPRAYNPYNQVHQPSRVDKRNYNHNVNMNASGQQQLPHVFR